MIAKYGRILTGISAVTLLSLGVSGCSSEKQGVAEPGPSPSVSSSEKTIPSSVVPVSASIDPCELISAADLADIGKFESEYREGGAARSCYWGHSFENGGDGFGFGVSVRDAQTIESVNDNGGGLQSADINQRPAVSTEDPNSGDCTFAMKIDDLSRVDVTVTGEDGCEIAEVIAGLVEPRLPDIP
ncbi:DUF3558 domain-containing protein [Saccharomonospora piscinae]|uniref:DUF3558 family protein n=1 Tax=Saccharomonospora piscinae TaxID=687388 RepID=UPI001106DCED|nr:DUF3558 family protein [Saccharomonospora piscinae]TLW93872.1 DUF3558 domain-containing protein [Saccharomonospora piscinae]